MKDGTDKDGIDLTDIDAVKASLTDKQRRFCEEYVVDFNGKQAAIRAGYSDKTAATIASENLTKPNVRKFLDHLKNNLSEATGVTAVKIIREYAKYIPGLIEGENGLSVGDAKDRLTALKGLRDMLGLDAPKRTELTGKDGVPIEADGSSIVVFSERARPLTISEKEDNPDFIEGNNVPPNTPLDQIDLSE